mmetsp:Transcript_68386/g.113675  ORF Transcript_68386/g.113675 Transcript_68386/m.113675 type:complete len:260 (-) Transcript_68386:514-1293(-)
MLRKAKANETIRSSLYKTLASIELGESTAHVTATVLDSSLNEARTQPDVAPANAYHEQAPAVHSFYASESTTERQADELVPVMKHQCDTQRTCRSASSSAAVITIIAIIITAIITVATASVCREHLWQSCWPISTPWLHQPYKGVKYHIATHDALESLHYLSDVTSDIWPDMLDMQTLSLSVLCTNKYLKQSYVCCTRQPVNDKGDEQDRDGNTSSRDVYGDSSSDDEDGGDGNTIGSDDGYDVTGHYNDKSFYIVDDA